MLFLIETIWREESFPKDGTEGVEDTKKVDTQKCKIDSA